MSIDLFVLTPHPVEALAPRLIGLGVPPFSWPRAEAPQSWAYDGARLSFTAARFEDAVARDDADGLYRRMARYAPAGTRSVLSLYLRDYRDDFEHALACALDGAHTSDHALYSELYDDGIAVSDPPDEGQREWGQRLTRAAFFGDRHAMTSAEGAAMIDAALDGSKDALEVLLFWAGWGKSTMAATPPDLGAPLREVLLRTIATRSRIADPILVLFSTHDARLLSDRAALDALARVTTSAAFEEWKAEEGHKAGALADQKALLQAAKDRGDFF